MFDDLERAFTEQSGLLDRVSRLMEESVDKGMAVTLYYFKSGDGRFLYYPKLTPMLDNLWKED